MAQAARRERLVTAALLALAILVVAGTGLGHSLFLQLPDSALGNPLLSGPSHLPTILSAEFMMFSEGQYRPLSYVVLALLRGAVPADASAFWHGLLLATHWLNALLLARLVRWFAGSLWPSLFAGLVFAAHPLVSIFAADAHLYHFSLGLTFYLGALHLYLRAGGGDGGRPLAGSLGLYLLGLFTTKAVFALPLMVAAYEGLYCRSGWRQVLRRLALFLVPTAALAPLWWTLRPHPLHFSYIAFPPGSTWFTFYSVVSASEYYARGLLLGWGLPAAVHEMAPQLYSLASGRFWALLVVNLAILAVGLGLLRRRHWGGLGLVLMLAAMLPYSTTTLNNAEDYVSWKYLYPVLAGLCLFLGWLMAAGRRRGGGAGIWAAALWLCLPFFGWQQARLNGLAATAVEYWEHVRQVNPASQTANLELGRARLDQGNLEAARARLFDPAVKELYTSAQLMCQYYTRQGELLPAAVHLRMARREGQGMQFGHGEPLMAEVMYAAGALDHADAALGKVLTSNPYNLGAMETLALIWARKGYVRAAEKILQRMRALDPDAAQVERVSRVLAERRRAPGRVEQIAPPSPSWLRYATQGAQDAQIRRDIVAYVDEHPGDPIALLEAGSCLSEAGEHARALEKLQAVTAAMPAWFLGWAMRSWIAAEGGDLEAAVAAGQHALALNNRDGTVYNTLGILQARLANRNPDDPSLRAQAVAHFRESLRLNPRNVSAYVNLGKELARQGKGDQAAVLYRRALILRPDCAEAHFGMGNLRAGRGELEEAIDSYREALGARRQYPEASYNLGLALARQGDFGEADQSFRDALASTPQYSPARDALATLLIQQGRFGEAIEVLREGVRLAPGHMRGSLMLATLLASCPDRQYRSVKAALGLAESLCQATDYRNSDALLVLAEVHSEAGDYGTAARQAALALQVADADARPQHAARIRQRLQAFRSRLDQD